jgi:LPS sulfotransferase NodH
MRQPDRGAKFVVLSSQRSGSTWLVSLLNGVAGTRAYGELFLERKKSTEAALWNGASEYPHFPEVVSRGSRLRARQTFAYLDALYAQEGAVGFKLMYTQLMKYPEIAIYLFLHRTRVLHLVRRNLLDVLISREIKNKTRQPHIVAGESRPEDLQVVLNPKKLLERLERRKKRMEVTSRLLRWSTLPYLEVAYEELLSDPTSFGRVCRFLAIDVEEAMPESALVKINRKSHPELISNYAEIKAALIGTPFAHFIE